MSTSLTKHWRKNEPRRGDGRWLNISWQVLNVLAAVIPGIRKMGMSKKGRRPLMCKYLEEQYGRSFRFGVTSVRL
jgi:hypothetical protein